VAKNVVPFAAPAHYYPIGGTFDNLCPCFGATSACLAVGMLRRAPTPTTVYGEARCQELLNSKLEDTLHVGKAMSKPGARAPHNQVLAWVNGGPGIDALDMPVLPAHAAVLTASE
jgi:hypothetical protein